MVGKAGRWGLVVLVCIGCGRGPLEVRGAELQSSASLTPPGIQQLLAGAVERLLSTVGESPRVTYWHHDHLGSVTLALGPDGQVRGHQGFMPYGRIKDRSGDIGLYGFTGQEPDASTGLLHFLQRYLDVESGRWTSPDLLFAIADVSGMNRFGESTTAYNYVAGNPIGAVDPSGAKATKAEHNTRLASKRAGQKSAVMVDGHLSNKVAGAGDKKTNGTVNYKKITDSSVKNKISGSTALADADMYMTHSVKGTVGGKKKGAEISAEKISVKHYSKKSHSMDSKAMTPKEFANHLTGNNWGKEQLVLASCWSGTPDYTIGGVKSAFAGHLAQELSAQSGGTITIIAPDATVGVSEGSGEFYTYELGSTSKKQGEKDRGFANWNVFESTGGGAPTMRPMANWEGRSQVAGF